MARLARHRQQGVTLVELIVTIAVIVVLLSMGIPAVQNMSQSNRLSTEANRFISDMLLARSEAVKRQFEVAACPSANGTSCADSDELWLLFVDNDEDGERDTDETILQVQSGLGSGQYLEMTPASSSIAFTPNGMVKGGAAINIKLKDNRDKFKCIQIAISGRTRVLDSDEYTTNCPGF